MQSRCSLVASSGTIWKFGLYAMLTNHELLQQQKAGDCEYCPLKIQADIFIPLIVQVYCIAPVEALKGMLKSARVQSWPHMCQRKEPGDKHPLGWLKHVRVWFPESRNSLQEPWLTLQAMPCLFFADRSGVRAAAASFGNNKQQCQLCDPLIFCSGNAAIVVCIPYKRQDLLRLMDLQDSGGGPYAWGLSVEFGVQETVHLLRHWKIWVAKCKIGVPPVSLPMAKWTSPDATATAEPDDEPPGILSGHAGLTGVP